VVVNALFGKQNFFFLLDCVLGVGMMDRRLTTYNSSICVCVRYCVRMDPGNAFRLVVKVSKWVVEDSYGRVEMFE
jgi:hypothetical protein